MRRALLFLALGMMTGFPPQGAFAHAVGDRYPNGVWGSGPLPDIAWGFDTDVPTGSFRDRVKDGDDPWEDGTAFQLDRCNTRP